MRYNWPEKSERILRDSWDAGVSSAVIGDQLGLTRCAILGKARRLGLKPRVDPVARSAAKVERERAKALAKSSRVIVKNTRIALNMTASRGRPAGAVEELTKGQLRAMLAEAVRNTAVMAVAA